MLVQIQTASNVTVMWQELQVSWTIGIMISMYNLIGYKRSKQLEGVELLSMDVIRIDVMADGWNGDNVSVNGLF